MNRANTAARAVPRAILRSAFGTKKTVGVLLTLSCAFVLADYLESFPGIYKDFAMNLPFTFEFYDAENGKPVSGVVVDASYKGENAVNRYHEFENIVDVLVRGGGFGYKKTFLFKKPSPRQTIKRINNKQIDFTFQHPGYQTVKRTLSKNKSGDSYVIKLAPIQISRIQE
jgi:hypothetical protein